MPGVNVAKVPEPPPPAPNEAAIVNSDAVLFGTVEDRTAYNSQWNPGLNAEVSGVTELAVVFH